MSRIRLPMILLPLLAFVFALRPVDAAAAVAADKTAPDLLPPSTLVYVEVADAKALLSATIDQPALGEVQKSSAFREAMQRPQVKKLLGVIAAVEKKAGVKWRPAIASIGGGGVVIAVEPLTQGVVVLVKPADMKTADAVRDALVSLARDDAKQKGKPDPITTKTYRGLTAYHAGDAIIADLGPWVMFSNKKALAQRVADTYLDGGDSLATDDDFNAAKRLAAGQGTLPSAWAFVRLAPLRLFLKQPWMDPATKSDNPGVEFLAGGLIPVAQHAPYVTASLWAGHGSLKLAAAAPMDPAWVPADRKFFFAPAGEGTAKPLVPPGTMLSITSYRDAAAMWQAGPDLFTEAVATQMAQTDSGLSQLLGGKSFGTDVLGAFKPQIQFVVAKQEYPAGSAMPSVRYPGAALVLEIKRDQFASVRKHFRVAFQSVVAFANLDGATKNRLMLELQTEHRGDAEIQFATYVPDDSPPTTKPTTQPAKPNDTAYLNVTPALVLTPRRMILSSTRQLAEQLADLDAQPDSTARIAENTLAHADAQLAADLIEQNKEQLIANNMLQKGHDRKTAEREIAILHALVAAVRDVQLRLAPEAKSIRLELEIQTADKNVRPTNVR